MAIKKSELYSSLWKSCDELRGGMDSSQYKDYVLVLLFIIEVTVDPHATFTRSYKRESVTGRFKFEAEGRQGAQSMNFRGSIPFFVTQMVLQRQMFCSYRSVQQDWTKIMKECMMILE